MSFSSRLLAFVAAILMTVTTLVLPAYAGPAPTTHHVAVSSAFRR